MSEIYEEIPPERLREYTKRARLFTKFAMQPVFDDLVAKDLKHVMQAAHVLTILDSKSDLVSSGAAGFLEKDTLQTEFSSYLEEITTCGNGIIAGAEQFLEDRAELEKASRNYLAGKVHMHQAHQEWDKQEAAQIPKELPKPPLH